MDFSQSVQLLAAAAKSLQSCLTLCDPIDSSPPGSTVPGILQARTLEWVAISFPNAWKWKVKVKSLSRVQLLATTWTAAHQAPPSMGFSRQEYWSRLPLPSPNLTRNSCQICSHYSIDIALLSSDEYQYSKVYQVYLITEKLRLQSWFIWQGGIYVKIIVKNNGGNGANDFFFDPCV